MDGKEEPLTRGRIQLQSEGAEVFYRNIRLRPITEIPAEFQQAMKEPPANTLTEKEKADGWKLLFDGTSTKGWRGYKQKGVPAGWQAIDGALVRVEKAGDLITEEQFGDFELVFDWKVSHGGNSGVFYRATEDTQAHLRERPPSTRSATARSGPTTRTRTGRTTPCTRRRRTRPGRSATGTAAGSWPAATPSSTGSTARRW